MLQSQRTATSATRRSPLQVDLGSSQHSHTGRAYRTYASSLWQLARRCAPMADLQQTTGTGASGVQASSCGDIRHVMLFWASPTQLGRPACPSVTCIARPCSPGAHGAPWGGGLSVQRLRQVAQWHHQQSMPPPRRLHNMQMHNMQSENAAQAIR